PNDDFAAAEQIAGATGSVVGSRLDATVETSEPASMPLRHSIWYAWTATSYGYLNFDAVGAWAWAFSGDALGNLTLLSNGGVDGDRGRRAHDRRGHDVPRDDRRPLHRFALRVQRARALRRRSGACRGRCRTDLLDRGGHVDRVRADVVLLVVRDRRAAGERS